MEDPAVFPENLHHFHCNHWCSIHTSSTAQGGGGSFKNRKPIGEIGCCEWGMAERSHWWTERCLRSPLFLSLSLNSYLCIYVQGGATSTTLAHAAESGPFSVPHECLRWATNLSCRNGSNKAERYMQKAPAETKAMKCNQRQRERSHTIILPHAPLNQCCFSQTGDLLASKYSTASLPRIQVQWNNQLWFRGEGFLYGAGYFLCCREKHAKRMDQWQRLL